MRRFRFRLTILLLLCFCFNSHGQEVNPFYQGLVSAVSYDTILANLQKFESLGVKETGTVALDNTADWLIGKYQSYGYTNIVRDTFYSGGHRLYNIVVTRMGTLFPPKYLIVDGHYDTYQGPGTNDNGSGVVSILEIARILSGVETQYSLRFINFSAEEDGLVGSQHYVDHTVVPFNMNILLVLNIDEVGGVSGATNNKVTCERDESSPSYNNAISSAFTDTLVKLTTTYSELETHIYHAYGSDYVPFQEAGKTITGFYETNESNWVHSPNDVLSRMSPEYVTQVAKASVGAVLYFSQAYPLTTAVESLNLPAALHVFPNPANESIAWKFPEARDRYNLSLFDSQERLLAVLPCDSGDSGKVDIHWLKSGIYFLRFDFRQGQPPVFSRFIKCDN